MYSYSTVKGLRVLSGTWAVIKGTSKSYFLTNNYNIISQDTKKMNNETFYFRILLHWLVKLIYIASNIYCSYVLIINRPNVRAIILNRL